MRLVALFTIIITLLVPVAQAQRDLSAEAREAVSQTLYASAATASAAERAFDEAFAERRRAIDALVLLVRDAEGQNRALNVQLADAQEAYVADLARRDRVFEQEIATLRNAVADIASTADGLAALQRFNAGDELGALVALDQLRDARAQARQVRDNIESAAEGRSIAILAGQARDRGRVDTASVIQRWEEVVGLDPGVFWDWISLARLYADAGRTAEVSRATDAALRIAVSDGDRIAVLFEIVSNQSSRYQVDWSMAEELMRLTQAQAQGAPQSLSRRTDYVSALLLGASVAGASGELNAALEFTQIARAQIEVARAQPNTSAADEQWLRQLEASTHLREIIAYQRVFNWPGVVAAASRAIPLLRTIRSESGDNPWVLGGLGWALVNLGVGLQETHGAGALPAFAEGLALRRQYALIDATSITALNGLSFAARQYGEALEEAGRLDEAGAAFREAFDAGRRMWEVDPDHIDNLQEAAQAIEALGRYYFRRRQFSEALQVFTIAVEGWTTVYQRFPDVPIVITNMENFASNLAQAHRNLGDNENAIRYFGLAGEVAWTGIRNVPGNTYYRHRLGNLQLTTCALAPPDRRRACYDNHLRDLALLIDQFPDDLVLREDRCLTSAIALERDPALAACNDVMALDARREIVYAFRGLAYLKARQWAQALADFETALTINPSNAFALYGRGLSRQGSGDVAGGQRDMRAALARQPTLAEQFQRYGAPAE